MTEPASLPWATEPDDLEGMEWNVHIVEAARPHMRIAFMSNGPDSEAHAEYLVKACNAFPDLVKALEAAREYLEGEEGFRPADRLRDEIDGLLGRVKGQSTP